MKQPKNEKKKESAKKIAMRVVCFVLALSMVASTFLYILYSIF